MSLMIWMMILGWLPWLLLGGAALWLGARLVRAIERRGSDRAELTALSARVQALESSTAAQEGELQQLRDGLRYTERLLGGDVK
jgi:hypothetical protein